MFSKMPKKFSKRKQKADFGKPEQENRSRKIEHRKVGHRKKKAEKGRNETEKSLPEIRNYEGLSVKWATISSMSMSFSSESFRLIS